MNMFKPAGSKTYEEYIAKLSEPRRSQMQELFDFICKTVPELAPYMAASMIGFGKFHYKSRSGREGDWPLIALASQKNYISVYVCAVDGDVYIAEKYKSKLPKASIGKSCIRFKKLEDIDLDVLAEIFRKSVKLGGFSATK